MFSCDFDWLIVQGFSCVLRKLPLLFKRIIPADGVNSTTYTWFLMAAHAFAGAFHSYSSSVRLVEGAALRFAVFLIGNGFIYSPALRSLDIGSIFLSFIVLYKKDNFSGWYSFSSLSALNLDIRKLIGAKGGIFY